MVLNKPKPGLTNTDVKVTDTNKGRLLSQNSEPDHAFLAWEEQRASKWSAIFLPSIGTCLLVLGILLIVIGSVRDKADVIVLGVMLLIGSVIFFVLLYTAVCKPMCHRNQVDHFSYLDSNQTTTDYIPPPERPTSEPPAYSEGSPREEPKSAVSFMSAKPGLVPRDSVLYSAHKSRAFLATPATTKDVNFDEGLETPPPPRVALANGMMDIDTVTGLLNRPGSSTDLDVPEPALFVPGEPAPGPAVYDARKDGSGDEKEMTSLELL